MLVCNSESYDYVIIGPNGIEEFKNNEQTYLYNEMCDVDEFNDLINKYYSNLNMDVMFKWKESHK